MNNREIDKRIKDINTQLTGLEKEEAKEKEVVGEFNAIEDLKVVFDSEQVKEYIGKTELSESLNSRFLNYKIIYKVLNMLAIIITKTIVQDGNLKKNVLLEFL